MRMTIRMKNAARDTDLAAALEQYFAKAGRSDAGLAELQPALKALSEQRKNLQEKKLQVDNIKACDAVHRYLTNVRKIMDAYGDELGDTRLELGFAWHDSFNPTETCKQNHPSLEEVALIFNIAAILTSLAADQSRTSEEGLKIAHNYFRSASTIFAHLQTELAPRVLKPITTDLSSEGLGLCHATAHAQAQECFFESAARKSKNNALLSKLAQGTYSLFVAMDARTRSAGLKDKLHATWTIFAQFQSSYYQAEAQYRCGAALYPIPDEDAEPGPVTLPENLRIGESIARLGEAVRLLAAAKTHLSNFDKHVKDPDLHSKTSDLERRLGRQKRVAEKDNNLVYYQAVPDIKSLGPIEAKVVVKQGSIDEVLAPFAAAPDVPIPGFELLLAAGNARGQPTSAIASAENAVDLPPPPRAPRQPAPEPATAPTNSLPPDQERMVRALIEMGFPADKATHALQQTSFDLAQAVQILTSQ